MLMLMLIHLIFIFLKSVLINCQTTQNVRVLYVNEEGNGPADKALDVAITYVSKNVKLGVKVDVQRVWANHSDSSTLLDSLCRVYGNALAAQAPPHVVLDMTTSGEASDTVKAFSKALSLPTISTSFGQKDDIIPWRNLNIQQKSFLVQIQPPADVTPEIIRDIITKQNFTNAAVLYDQNFVMKHKYKTLLQNVPARHILVPIDKPTETKNKLAQLQKLNLVNFFILGSLSTIKNVLDAANSLLLFSQKYSWHAVTLERNDLKCSCKNASVLFIKPIIATQSQDRLGVIKTSYQLTTKPEILAAFYFDTILFTFMTLRDMIADGLWSKNISYITCDEYDKKNSPERRFECGKVEKINQDKGEQPTFSPFRISQNGESQMDFDMQMSLVSIRDGSSDKSIQIGTWNTKPESPMNLINPIMFSNFSSKLIYRIVTVVQQPFVMEDEKAPKGFKGYCIDLIDEISKIMHFDYELIPVSDGKFGSMDEHGIWDGIVRELLERRADIGLGSMSLTAERKSAIDFTIPFYDLVGITILMKMNKGTSSLFKFLTVLESDVWFCILAAYFITSFVLWAFDRWSPYSYQNNREKYKNDEDRREFTFKECLWFCMTSLTPQGGGEAPKNLSGRLVAATWWLFGFIIIASYTANLAAFLTVSRLDSSIENFDDLAKQYKILYAPLNGSSAMNYFQRMADIEAKFYEIWKDMSLNDTLSEIERAKLAVWDYPVSDKYSKMWQVMQESGLPLSLKEAVERVKNSKSTTEGFAFLGDATDIRYLVLTNCDLQMVGEEFSKKPYAIGVQQGSPLREQLNYAILQLTNNRFLEGLKEKWWTKNDDTEVCEELDDQSEGISIRNIGGVFIVIFTGIVIACIVLAFEYWWYKYRKVNSDNTVYPSERRQRYPRKTKHLKEPQPQEEEEIQVVSTLKIEDIGARFRI